VALIRAAAERKVQRRETLPSRGERERRLAEKARRAEIKKGRRGASEG